MRYLCLLTATLATALAQPAPTAPRPPAAPPAKPAAVTPGAPAAAGAPEVMLQRFFGEALTHGEAYGNLRVLVTQTPGRLSGSANLERAVTWAQKTLTAVGPDRVYLQDVMVPHWERGEPEAVVMVTPGKAAELLSALALGNSVPTPKDGLIADAIEVKSIEELKTLGAAQVSGKIVFFNSPMDPAIFSPSAAYGAARAIRSQGPAAAAAMGAVAALTRSLTQARDNLPHTGATDYTPAGPNIPAAALSALAADKLHAALASGVIVRLTMRTSPKWLPPALSHNVIGEIKGREFPNQVILVGGHLDSWDVAPGAHDDGAGVVQSIEVLRLFRALGLKPRHTVRCVLFVNEENGLAGALKYAEVAKAGGEKHLLALETDNGGFQPRGFNLGSTQGDLHEQAAARWGALFAPYGAGKFVKGSGGADVAPLLLQGATVGELIPESQRYFDLHHTTNDTFDKVNDRELHLGAAALASLVWLYDQQGL